MPRALTPSEVDAIENEIVQHAPAGLSDQEFDRYFGPAFEQARAVAENTSDPLQGSALKRALSGLWEQVNPVAMAEGVYTAATHPVETLSNLAQAHQQQFTKAGDAFTQGRYLEAAGHAGAGLLPVVGPAAASIGEGIAETGDIATGVGQTAGLLAPMAVAKMGPTLVKGGRLAAKAAGSAVESVNPDLVAVASPRAGAALRVAQRVNRALTPKAERAVVASAESPAPVAALVDKGPPPKVFNELAIQARRQGVKLSEADYATAADAVYNGADAAAVVAELKAAGGGIPLKIKLTAEETAQFLKSKSRGASDEAALEAIRAARTLKSRHGLPSGRTVSARVAERNRTGRW